MLKCVNTRLQKFDVNVDPRSVMMCSCMTNWQMTRSKNSRVLYGVPWGGVLPPKPHPARGHGVGGVLNGSIKNAKTCTNRKRVLALPRDDVIGSWQAFPIANRWKNR